MFTNGRTQPIRKVKAVPKEPTQSVSKHPRISFFNKHGGQNPVIFEARAIPDTKAQSLRDTGARITNLDVATPKREYPGLSLKKTPNGHIVHPMFNIEGVVGYKYLTPPRTPKTKGHFYFSEINKENLENQLPEVARTLKEPIEFIVTHESIQQRSLAVRHMGQKQLMKVSCSDVFRAHDIDISSEEGRSYHWAHLVAFFLGGPQDSSNLVPSTAEANYNTLELIETFIHTKIKVDQVKQVVMSVEAKYMNESPIPAVLDYKLSWESATSGKTCTELFNVFPNSNDRMNSQTLETVQLCRRLFEQ